MKKRILALLLAGIMTASFASCISSSKDNEKTGPGGTEQRQTKAPTTASTQQKDPTIQWKDEDDYVFTADATVKLRVSVDTVAGAVDVTGATKLHRIKSSTAWSMVEYNGAQYYVPNQSITTDDLTGESFTTCTPTTMYVNSAVSLRKYASSTAPISVVIDSLAVNTEVIVVAKGESWNKVKITNEDNTVSYYFVFAKYLSAEKVKDYAEYFTPCNETKMYVTVDSVYLRTRPVTNDDTSIADYRVKGNEVIVVGTGTGDYTAWSRIKVADAVKDGDPQTYSYYYISNSCISATQNGSPVTITLDEFLSPYPAFTKCEATYMYVLKDANIKTRKTPVFEGDKNIGTYLTSLTKVKVVASGIVDTYLCYVLELGEGDFHFVTTTYLTPNADGTATAPTLDELLKKYKNFESVTAASVYATGVVNCYVTPEAADKVPLALKKGDNVTLVAKGKAGTAEEIWCIVKTEDGTFYFAAAERFSTTAPAA